MIGGGWLGVAMAVGFVVSSGCSSPPAAVVTPVEPEWVTPAQVVLVDGTYVWHDTSGPAGALDYYALASQAISHPCVWDSGSSREPYFNNLRLPSGPSPLPPWPGNLTVTLDWTSQDWIGSQLRLAYRGPGVESWQEEGPLSRAESHTIRVRVTSANETGEEGQESAEPANWTFWACLPTDTLEPEQPFMGSLTVKVSFAADPMPASMLAPAKAADGRTARPG